MSTYRYVLQGCNESNLASAVTAMRAKISGIELSVEKSSRGYYFVSVNTEADHDRVKTALVGVLWPFQISVAIVDSWAPTNFSEFS